MRMAVCIGQCRFPGVVVFEPALVGGEAVHGRTIGVRYLMGRVLYLTHAGFCAAQRSFHTRKMSRRRSLWAAQGAELIS